MFLFWSRASKGSSPSDRETLMTIILTIVIISAINIVIMYFVKDMPFFEVNAINKPVIEQREILHIEKTKINHHK